MKRTVWIWLFLALPVFGQVAPRFSETTLDGKKISLEQSFKPGRFILLSFWATWCSPCLEELKTISSFLKADPKQNLDVIAVNVDTSETSTDVKPTLKLYQFQMPVIADPQHKIFSKYHEAKSLPFSVLINSRGDIVETFNGYQESMTDKIKLHLATTRNDKK